MKTRSMTKAEFNRYNDNFSFINMVVHEEVGYQTLITDDVKLTDELKTLKEAVKRFESNTGLKLSLG